MFARIEDEADLWLRKNDPFYTSKSSRKMEKYDFPYETPEMEKRRKENEIPLSNLSFNQAWEIGAVNYRDDGSMDIEL